MKILILLVSCAQGETFSSKSDSSFAAGRQSRLSPEPRTPIITVKRLKPVYSFALHSLWIPLFTSSSQSFSI